MSFEITGTVVEVGALQSRQWEGKTFNNRSIIISMASGDQGQYLKHAEFDVSESQFEYLDRNKPGDTVMIKFSLDGGKPYTNNKTGQLSVFNKLRAFYIGNDSQSQPSQTINPGHAQAAPQYTAPPVNPVVAPVDDGFEDTPF